ncbi:diacylglycerol kinase family lipid kinase, partial [Citrobacter sp. AAK_AS5]
MESSNNNKWVFIVNPIAGNGFGKLMVPIIRDNISRYGIDGEIIQTERSGHAVELSRQYLDQGYGVIVGVGGDGTANEVARP